MTTDGLLELASEGDAVRKVQHALARSGLYTGRPDGSFGPLTEAALRAFQTEHRLDPDGVVGPETWDRVLDLLTEPDVAGRVRTLRIEGPRIVDHRVEDLPDDAFSHDRREEKGDDDSKLDPPEKVHPLLLRWSAERSGDEEELLVVTFRDDVELPRFPPLVTDEPRDSDRNRRTLERIRDVVGRITEQRADGYAQLTRELADRHGARVLETFWLIKAALVRVPLRNARSLADREDVSYVEPSVSGEEPPADANPNNDVEDARALVEFDTWFDLAGGWIGLLDTGVRFTHTQFKNPNTLDFLRDCVNGGSDCNTGPALNPNDDFWNHGTHSAGILGGNANLGTAFRGVTKLPVDSWKVYNNQGLVSLAVIRAFQNAVIAGDRTLVAEIQSQSTDQGSISLAADQAFDTGSSVIAANGNFGPAAGSVRAPANAHKAIGVGNVDVQTLAIALDQGVGPAPDGRLKPDIQGPSNTESAGNQTDTALGVFGGTSGATPYAASAAALLRLWLEQVNPAVEPGEVYAWLILCGQKTSSLDNTSGAGRIRMPGTGYAWTGKVDVTHQQVIDIPLVLGGGSTTLDGAVWWPEKHTQTHNDIDLYLVNSGGTVVATSGTTLSVFERVRVNAPIANGTWKLRIRGYNVPAGPQAVYYAAYERTP
ncbi:S8 family serine peptidase [Saccharothrix variisporea]|uniref:Putative peptidoglycan binding protein n=1 Tax=Saccharothrix variisporea TaxID=543527 RepID=A0A495XN34_9PSEU|nr:S8 family serine peptidase [Saccharothrix variisporea]RKT74615.1 putative peptidoglycan binding protein [Saccharothrix variisporea]